MILSLCFLIFSIWWQLSLYRIHTKRVLFMIDALENNDNAIHFPEEKTTPETRDINRALNRVGHILYNVKSETAQQEKYYELILDCINTGVLVLNDNGAIYQKNNEALRLLGLNVLTHIRQLSKVDVTLMQKVEFCRTGEKLQITFNNERGTVNLSIRVSDITIRKEHLRILALSDINSELDEKEIDSWIRLTRVLTHEIMNSVTPITSLSDTLLSLSDAHDEEIRSGLQTISTTGKGLLAFVESYRRFTRIPTPEPSLFYVKAFIDRMVELARHQNTCKNITFHTDISPADLIVYADENLISQVVINLLKNAIQAIGTQADGKIEISARCNDSEEVLIEIKNNGPVIPPEIADHIFIPFFTTKEGGSGIGLSISRQIMRLSGGSITLLPGKETKFVLKFK
jgi:nitrogen fixation/metabolism regulation signal transduction histidine kinase